MNFSESIFLDRRRAIAVWLISSFFTILVLTMLIFCIQMNRANQHLVNDFNFMQPEVVNLILKKDLASLDRILHVIDTDSMASMRIERNGEIFASYPSDDFHFHQCSSPTILPITHYNVLLGQVVVCLNRSRILYAAVSNPAVFMILIFVGILILSASVLPYLGYQHGLTKLIETIISEKELVQGVSHGIDDPIVSHFRKLFDGAVKNKLVAERALASERLARQVSHDIRSPLMALKTVIKFSEGELSSDKSEMLSKVCNRISGIADDLLRSTRESMATPTEACPVDIKGILERCADEKKLEFQDDAHVILDIDSSIMNAVVDVSEFARAVSNLLNNAIEASTDKTVILKARASDRLITISFEDNGPGFAMPIRHQFTSHRDLNYPVISTTKANGNGLGLSHAIKTVQNFGGRLFITKVFDGMNAVNIELPRIRP